MWKARLQDNYGGNFGMWETYSNAYGLAARLGFDTPEEAWEANPVIQGSVNPEDFKTIGDQYESD